MRNSAPGPGSVQGDLCNQDQWGGAHSKEARRRSRPHSRRGRSGCQRRQRPRRRQGQPPLVGPAWRRLRHGHLQQRPLHRNHRACLATPRCPARHQQQRPSWRGRRRRRWCQVPAGGAREEGGGSGRRGGAGGWLHPPPVAASPGQCGRCRAAAASWHVTEPGERPSNDGRRCWQRAAGSR
jgi:hypothetical protein